MRDLGALSGAVVSGRGIELSPPAITFRKVEANVTYVATVTVRNTTTRGQRVRFGATGAHFRVEVANDIELAPGLQVEAEIHFCSPVAGSFDGALRVAAGRQGEVPEELVVPLQALQPRAEMVVAEAFDFGAVVPGASVTRSLPLFNAGDAAGTLKVAPAGAFSAAPSEVHVAAGASALLKLQCAPADVGSASATLPLSVANGVGPPSIDVRASIVRQAIEVLSENGTARLEAVEFGRVYCGLTRTRRVLLSNAGPTTVNWRVNRLLDGADSGGDDGTPSAPPPPPPPPPPAPPAPPAAPPPPRSPPRRSLASQARATSRS